MEWLLIHGKLAWGGRVMWIEVLVFFGGVARHGWHKGIYYELVLRVWPPLLPELLDIVSALAGSDRSGMYHSCLPWVSITKHNGLNTAFCMCAIYMEHGILNLFQQGYVCWLTCAHFRKSTQKAWVLIYWPRSTQLLSLSPLLLWTLPPWH